MGEDLAWDRGAAERAQGMICGRIFLGLVVLVLG